MRAGHPSTFGAGIVDSGESGDTVGTAMHGDFIRRRCGENSRNGGRKDRLSGLAWQAPSADLRARPEGYVREIRKNSVDASGEKRGELRRGVAVRRRELWIGGVGGVGGVEIGGEKVVLAAE